MSEKVMGFYRCKAAAGRNAEFPIHVLVDVKNDWPERVMLQRGLLGNARAMRAMTAEEIEGHATRVRAMSYKYKTLEGLLEDEVRCGSDAVFLECLKKAFEDVKS